MHSHKIEVSHKLKDHVHSLWCTHGMPLDQITPDLLIPDGLLEIVFVLDGAYKKRKLSSKHVSLRVDRSVVIGIQDHVVMSSQLGPVKSIAIKFDPMKFYLLFGDAGVAALNQHVPLSIFGNNELLKLDENLSRIESIPEVIHTLETFFTNYDPRATVSTEWVITSNCLTDIWLSKGNIDIDKLAKTHHKNMGQLELYFKKFIGLPPKEMAAIIKTASQRQENDITNTGTAISPSQLLGDIFKQEDLGEPNECK